MYSTLEASDLSYIYRNGRGLRATSFAISQGVCGLLGSNGAGKSTLLSILSTFLEPQEGSVLAGGQVIDRQTRREYRRSLGWVPQQLALDGRRSVADFMIYASWLKEVPRKIRRASCKSALERVSLEEHWNDNISELTRRMQRRLMIAQGLVNDPSILLLDEPTAGLDPLQRSSLCSLLVELGESQIVLVSTHLLEDVSLCCDSVVVLRDGRADLCQSLEKVTNGRVPTVEILQEALGYGRSTVP